MSLSESDLSAEIRRVVLRAADDLKDAGFRPVRGLDGRPIMYSRSPLMEREKDGQVEHFIIVETGLVPLARAWRFPKPTDTGLILVVMPGATDPDHPAPEWQMEGPIPEVVAALIDG